MDQINMSDLPQKKNKEQRKKKKERWVMISYDLV